MAITIDTSSYNKIHTGESAFQGEMDDDGSDVQRRPLCLHFCFTAVSAASGLVTRLCICTSHNEEASG